MITIDKSNLINKIKLLEVSASTLSDELLGLYIEIADSEVKDYCKNSDISIPDNLLIQMVQVKIQRKGTEAVSSSNYAGNGENYLKEFYPPPVIIALENLRKSNRRLRSL